MFDKITILQMLSVIFKKNISFFLVFLVYQILIYINQINTTNPIPYLNFIIYFIIFLFIKDSYNKTKFNRTIVILFFLFFGYLSIILSLSILTINIEDINYVSYLLIEIFLRLLILTISIYLLVYSFRLFSKSEFTKLSFSIVLSIFLVLLNQYKYILNPSILQDKNIWSEWLLRNYITMVFVIFILLIFWYRYYLKYFVVSEYLNSIIFIFTLTNLIEPLHFISMQWNIENWFKGQLINLILNVCMMFVWYARLVYLNSDISQENERYLMNFQYLNGFISKPRQGHLITLIRKLSSNIIFSILFGIVLISLILYVIKKITLVLLLNTILILVIVMLALFFSFRSIKRDWQTQLGLLMKSKKSE